jgi:serine/threonine protein kinase
LASLNTTTRGRLIWVRNYEFVRATSRIIRFLLYSCVYQAIHHVTGEIQAVKEVVTTKSRIRAATALRVELDTLRQLRHANIVRYRGMFERDDSLCVAMEYCPGGSLSSVLSKFGPLDDHVARNYTGQILCGLSYLHRHCIVHR